VLFNNFNTGNFGTWVNVADITELYFNDQHGGVEQLIVSDVWGYVLTAGITVPGYSSPSLYLGAGTIILGWNDSYTGDNDHDDMIIAIRPVPEPGLLLLLGSSLFTLAAFRKFI
ncbi:MAG: hypothetical protein ABIJ42_11070, partial [Acidobacteriota bacterium]